MVRTCVAVKCSNRHSKENGLTFHRFPKDPVRRQEWVRRMRRLTAKGGMLWTPPDWAALCSNHFASEMFDRTGQTVRLKPDAIPTIFDFHSRLKQKVNVRVSSVTRVGRAPSKLNSPKRLKKSTPMTPTSSTSSTNDARFDQDQFELCRSDGKKLLKWNAVPTVFDGSSERSILPLKRPVAVPVEHLIIHSVDHEYSKKPCLDKENILQDTVPLPVASSTLTSLQHMATVKDASDVGVILRMDKSSASVDEGVGESHKRCNTIPDQHPTDPHNLTDEGVKEPCHRFIPNSTCEGDYEQPPNIYYTSSTADLRQTLHQFQRCGYLCDTVLVGEDGQVKAHSCVLAAASSVFRMSMKSCSKPVEQIIVMPGVQVDLLEIAVHVAYTGEIKYTSEMTHLSRVAELLMELDLIVAAQVKQEAFTGLDLPTTSTTSGPDVRAYDMGHSVVDERIRLATVDTHNNQSSAQSCAQFDTQDFDIKDNISDSTTVTCCSSPCSDQGLNDVELAIDSDTVGNAFVAAIGKQHTQCIRKGGKINEAKHIAARDSNRTDERSSDSLDKIGCDSVCKTGRTCGDGPVDPVTDCAVEIGLIVEKQRLLVVSTTNESAKKIDKLKLKSNSDTVLIPSQGKLCETCGEVFETVKKYWSHRKRHELKKRASRVYCGECNISVATSAILRRHMMQHTGEKPYLCQHCGARFCQRPGLINHMSYHHPEMIATEPAIVSRHCPVCGLAFYNSTRLRIHVLSGCRRYNSDVRKRALGGGDVHPSSMDDGSLVQKYACKQCTKHFRFRASLLLHSRIHENFQPRTRQCLSSINKRDGYTDSDPCVCQKCGKQFSTPYARITHERLHTGEKPLACPQCGWKTSNHGDLFRHAVVHTGELPYKCRECGEAFQTAANRQSHQKSRHNSAKAYFESTAVDDDGRTVFVCKVCEKRFVSRVALMTHGRFHQQPKELSDTVKPFVCTVCNKRLRMKVHLQVHMRTHTGEKPFVCHLCTKAYKCNIDLRLHYRSVHRLELKKRQGKRRLGEDSHEFVSLDRLNADRSKDFP